MLCATVSRDRVRGFFCSAVPSEMEGVEGIVCLHVGSLLLNRYFAHHCCGAMEGGDGVNQSCLTHELPDIEEFLSPDEGLMMGFGRELIWVWNQIVLQARYDGTPAGFSSDLQCRKAVEQWKKQKEAYMAAHEYSLVPTGFSAPDCFVGRRAELKQLRRLFLEGGGRAKVLIHGMGGIGKTTLAAQYAACWGKEYDCVLSICYHTDLLHTICDDDQLQISNLSWHLDRFKTQSNYFREKWKLFGELLKGQRVLLILDDMNSLKDKRLSLLWELPCDVLITSRIYDEDWKASVVGLEAMNSHQDWEEFYRAYGGKRLTQARRKKLEQYRQRTGGNTLLMRLAVCNPKVYEAEYNGLEAYFLCVNALNGTDVQALRYLSLLPASGIEKELFLSASGLKETVLKKLIRMSLVWEAERNGVSYYSLHPVIAESVRHYFKPVPENCSVFLNGMGAQYENIWNAPYKEVEKAVPICFALLCFWPKLRAWLFGAYDSFITVLWIGGYFKEALDYVMRLYRECMSYYGCSHQVTGEIALRVAAVYHNSLRFQEAKEWYGRAFRILKGSEPYNARYQFHLMQAAIKMCRNERHEGKYESALLYWNEAEQALERYLQVEPNAVNHGCQLQMEKAKLLFAAGQLEEAEQLCVRTEQYYLQRYGGNDWPYRYFIVELRLLMAEIALKQQKAEKALRLASLCAERALAMRGKIAKETLGCQEILADAYAAMEREEEASALYRQILELLEHFYPLQKKWHQSIEEKERSIRRSEKSGRNGLQNDRT